MADIGHAMHVLGQVAGAACEDPEWAEPVVEDPEVRDMQELAKYDVLIRLQVWVNGASTPVPGAREELPQRGSPHCQHSSPQPRGRQIHAAGLCRLRRKASLRSPRLRVAVAA